jgi:hypothetical protein
LAEANAEGCSKTGSTGEAAPRGPVDLLSIEDTGEAVSPGAFGLLSIGEASCSI